MANKDSGSGFSIGLVLGAIVGLAVGFLYAPRPGKETRELLREKAEKVKEGAEKVKEGAEKVKGKATEIAEEVKEKATEVAEEVKETTAEAKKKAQAKLDELKSKGVQTEFVTLHVGLGTFQPVKTEDLTDHQMHSEWFELSEDTANRLNQVKKSGKKIIAVGTTSVRVLESCSDSNGQLESQSGETDIFIYPGYEWKFVDQLITNFHVPKSTLLMLVSSFADRNFILKAYEKAKNNHYRFFSFGDSMLIQ